MVKGAGKDSNSGLSKVEKKPAPVVRLPRFAFVKGETVWQVPDTFHLDALKEAADRFGWEIEDQGVVKATGLNRYKIRHKWLYAQFLAEQAERDTEYENRKAAMYSLPHLVFKGNVCKFMPESDEQIRGLELKAERLGWEYEKLPDGSYAISRNKKAA
jgi:hypothetical protein